MTDKKSNPSNLGPFRTPEEDAKFWADTFYPDQVWALPDEDEMKPKTEYVGPPIRYVIDVDAHSYTLLLRLVMKYASGTGADKFVAQSSIDMRVDLANARRYNANEGKNRDPHTDEQ